MLRKAIIVVTCTGMLASCQTVQDNPNIAGGAILGALGGAVVGTLFGGDDRRNALIGAGIGLLAGAAVGAYLDNQEEELRSALAGTGAQVERRGKELYVRFPGQVTFAPNSADIRPDFYPALDGVSTTLNRYPESYLDVVGHTDNVGSEAYNQDLSDRRSNSVANYFRSRGVAAGRIASYGVRGRVPIASNETASGRQQNRRVELRIIPAQDG